jgi:hypothetical protein
MKKYLLNNTSWLLNNMKTYTISKKKKTELKTLNKLQMRFWGSRCYFLAPKMMIIAIDVNPVDLIANFLWPCSTPQSEFPIKSYGRLKLRLSDFGFYFFCLSSLFLIFFLLSHLCPSLSHLSFYENKWKMVGNP